MLKVYGCLVLVCVAVVYGEDSGAQLDKAFVAKEKETMQMYESVEHQLSAAQEDEVRQEIEESMKEVENLQLRASENVASWRKTLQRIKDVTQKNIQTLQRIRKEKEDKKQLELEMEKQRELEKELELHTEELRQLQELERLQELEKKKLLERKQNMEKLLFATEVWSSISIDGILEPPPDEQKHTGVLLIVYLRPRYGGDDSDDN
ncbi:unnamed protein product [Peronospora farinosa]|uniref:Uncharacterized protein n=1 Tax=Peronospora farinosa TaxID=134698 RepID=A0ABN8C0I9_9STRA|nr:unnamed protein product [Peronospora farinosa]